MLFLLPLLEGEGWGEVVLNFKKKDVLNPLTCPLGILSQRERKIICTHRECKFIYNLHPKKDVQR